MGRGPGPIRERISLADYAVRFPEMFDAVVDDTYTFTEEEHTIEEKYVVIFAETDKIRVPPNSTVNLFGCLEIPDTTADNQFTRIIVQGSLIQRSSSTIEMGNISGNFVRGIRVDGTMTQNAGGVITIGNIEGNALNSIGIFTVGTLTTTGKITIGDVSNIGYGILINTGGEMTQNVGGEIEIGGVSDATSGGISIDGRMTQTGGEITIGDVSDAGQGIVINTGGTMTQNVGGEIEIAGVSGATSKGILENGTLDTSGKITIGDVSDAGQGIFISTNGTMTQTGGLITIEGVSDGSGIIIFTAGTLTTTGKITIGDVAGDGGEVGIFINTGGEMTQNVGGEIEIAGVSGATSYGIFTSGTLDTSGKITIGNISNRGRGIDIPNTGATMTQNVGGEIEIGDVSGATSYGIFTSGTLTTTGKITIVDVSDAGQGIAIATGGTMTQNAGGEIEIGDVSGEGTIGILSIVESLTVELNAKITVSNVQSDAAGIVSTVPSGMNNEGTVEVMVSGGIKYSDAIGGPSVTPPTFNFVGGGDYD